MEPTRPTTGCELIKGGGAALTREKIIAAVARRFVCIVDESKLVQRLGRFPLPVEVIPMARSHVARATGRDSVDVRCTAPGSSPTTATTSSMSMTWSSMTPWRWRPRINQITGVVTVGLFARRPADELLHRVPGRSATDVPSSDLGTPPELARPGLTLLASIHASPAAHDRPSHSRLRAACCAPAPASPDALVDSLAPSGA